LLAIFAFFYTIPQLKSLGATLFAGAGVFAAVYVFTSQEAFSNIIGGILLLFSNLLE
jgi:small conductance mechanosensitive channel